MPLVKGSFILHTLYCQTFSTSMLFVILKIEGEVKRKGLFEIVIRSLSQQKGRNRNQRLIARKMASS